ncbi:MAG TPA: SRPBCC family protein [Bdellovibrionota bacterium]|nr:SRPBCC family protein [Bdellovibrionota bacterium]
MLKVTATRSISVQAPPEAVWDYTQDWNRRAEWDSSVSELISLTEKPRQVRARFKGGLVFDLEYKLDDRPRKTSLAMVNGNSRWIIGGGGSWRYDAIPGGTDWTQTNTLVLRDHWLMRLLVPFLRVGLGLSTAQAMRAAKLAVERSSLGSGLRS